MKLLVVDDNYEIRSVIKLLLRSNETEFVECSNGREAINAFIDFQPDFILMDIEMKIMDGLKATEQILKIDPGARIIIVTNHSEQFFRTAANDAGAIGFISKDNIIELKKIIN